MPRLAAVLAAVAAGVALLLGACSSTPAAPAAGPSGSGIDAARCAQNSAAGPITYLTGFMYGGSVSILDVVTAEQQGYYDDLCLDVTVQPGNAGSNAQLTSAGRAQLAGLGGPSDVISAVSNGADVVGVATYANTSAVEMLTVPASGITTLKDIEGKTLGYKGAVPPAVLAMLQKAGVDLAKVRQVSVGYDPSILVQGRVQALTAYKSNEPLTLRAAGAKVTEWDPAKYGIRSSFNTIVANAPWARAHPTAVQDFLRATFHGYAYTDAHVDVAVTHAAELAGAGYDAAANTRQWRAESALVRDTLVPGHGVGWQSVSQWAPEYAVLQRFRLVSKPVDLPSVVDTTAVAAVYDGPTLRWPATAGAAGSAGAGSG